MGNGLLMLREKLHKQEVKLRSLVGNSIVLVGNSMIQLREKLHKQEVKLGLIVGNDTDEREVAQAGGRTLVYSGLGNSMIKMKEKLH